MDGQSTVSEPFHLAFHSKCCQSLLLTRIYVGGLPRFKSGYIGIFILQILGLSNSCLHLPALGDENYFLWAPIQTSRVS